MKIGNTLKRYLLKDENSNVPYAEEETHDKLYMSQDKSYHKCEEMISNMHMNKNKGFVAPHKPILLLAILEMIKKGKLENETIILNKSLKEEFALSWDKYVVENCPFSPTCKTPFIHMDSESFWNLVDPHTAIIDIELFEIMRNPSYRFKIEDMLIDMVKCGLKPNSKDKINTTKLLTSLLFLGAIA